MAHSLCLASNLGWALISAIGVLGSVGRSNVDMLFLYRYVLALVSNVASITAIRYYRIRMLGKLAVLLFLPFIFLQLAEIWIVYKCDAGLSEYWGVSCSTLLIYPDGAKVVQVITDEIAVFLLSIANLFLLINCHIVKGYLLYDLPRNPSLQAFLSADSEAKYMSVEDEEHGNKVNNIFFCMLLIF